MFVGTQYYRPPNPPTERWEQDIRMIKDHGLSVIRMWFVPDAINPAEGQWDWAAFDRLFELAHENGLKVLIQYVPEGPLWKAKQRGQQSNNTTGCIDDPASRVHIEEYMTAVATRYRDHPAVFAYDIWNEPGGGICTCEFSQQAFRDFLRDKYPTIEALNRVQARSFASFEQVTLEDLTHTHDAFEFLRLGQQQMMKWRYDTARKLDPNRPLVSHGHGNGSYLIFPDQDQWLFAEVLDGWGCGFYEHTLPEAAFSFHAMQCCNEGKPWWLSECQCGSHWNNAGYYKPSAAFFKSLFVLALGNRADGMIFWQWAPQMQGLNESPQFGLTGLNSENNERTEMLKRMTAMLSRHKDIFDNMTFPTSQMALMWEPWTVPFEELTKSTHFEKLWEKQFIGWHTALNETGHPFDILNSRLVAERGVCDDLKLLFAPTQVLDRPGLNDKLKAWIEAGGTLVTGPMFSVFDEDTFVNRRYPPEWVGAKQREMNYPEAFSVRFVADGFEHLPDLPGTHFFEGLTLEDAEVLGAVGGQPVITRQRVGKGSVIYVATFAGNNYDTPPALRSFIQCIAAQTGLKPFVPSTSGCVIRTAQSGEGTVIFLTNQHKEATDIWLAYPHLEGTLTDLLTGEEIGSLGEGAAPISLPIAAEDSRVLLLNP